LKLKEPNALNVFNLRTMTVPPPHFEYTTIPVRYNLESAIDSWIISHLKGRYYIGRGVSAEQDPIIKIGFEDPKELSFFTLACPHLKYH